MRILIIEDDTALRTHVTAVLTAEGFAVDNAAEGEQGLYMATEYALDLAIIDLGLPRKSGIDVIR